MIRYTRPVVLSITIGLVVCSWNAISEPDIVGRASQLVHAGKLKDAERILRLALDTQPNSPQLHGALGEVMLKEEHFEQAVEELGRAVQLMPDSHQYSIL